MKKAYRFDDETVFYFDAFDNKHVAKGGSLAWRLNNPGLLLSHSLRKIGYHAIGTHHQYAIFSHPMIGKEAHRAWIISTKYHRPLIEIAKYYQPDNPKKYLEIFCERAGCSVDVKLSSLLPQDFEKFLNTIHWLAGFSPGNQHHSALIPKITARLYSPKRKMEFYLASDDQLLPKLQAIDWVEMHKLDAVIVHKNNGDIYLRSRPGHHFNQIRFKEDDYGPEKEFKNAVREVGQFERGQCIWGFINGISNTAAQALKSTTMISRHTGNQHVLSLINDGGVLGNLSDIAIQSRGIHNTTVQMGAQFFRMLIELSENADKGKPPPIIVFAHSQGALVAHLALKRLEQHERQRIRIFTLGGAAFVAPGIAHPESHNYFSIADPVAKYTSYDLCLFVFKLHDGRKIGLSEKQVIEHAIQEDINKHPLEAVAGMDKFRKERQEHYEQELQRSKNITIVEENISGYWEHVLDIPCYQTIVKAIINRYRQ